MLHSKSKKNSGVWISIFGVMSGKLLHIIEGVRGGTSIIPHLTSPTRGGTRRSTTDSQSLTSQLRMIYHEQFQKTSKNEVCRSLVQLSSMLSCRQWEWLMTISIHVFAKTYKAKTRRSGSFFVEQLQSLPRQQQQLAHLIFGDVADELFAYRSPGGILR